MQTEKNTENLEKKYKRIRKLADELVNKNEVYQKDIMNAEKKIESLEAEFNNLVENFQKFINEKEEEVAIKEREIAQKTEELRQSKQSRFECNNEDNFHPLNVDPEERNQAIEIYERI